MNLVVLLYSLVLSFISPKDVRSIDKSEFYKTFATTDLSSINSFIQKVSEASFPEKEAYYGALLMKKAGLVSNPKEKLSLFKQGHKKLENAISADTKNVEFRFLRLMIQENAPSILGYKNEIKEDRDVLKSSYKTMPNEAREALMEYSKNSKILHTQDFN